MKAYHKVQAARSVKRPTARVFIDNIFTDFIELHGDRRYGDDPAVITGIGLLDVLPVTVIGIERGQGIKDKVARNFGCAHPEGYRKALRHMKLAEKFSRPVLCFVDTAGAFCGIAAEERGQGQAIAENLMEMMTLKVPILTIIVGEGGSGGALALSVSDEVWMLENSIYSVISPEGCASILWKDSKKAPEASEYLKLAAEDLYRLGAIEQILKETSSLYDTIAANAYGTFLKNLSLPPDELTERRYARFRKF